MARFSAGKAAFEREFTPEEGLGPLFNQTRCSSCHDLPTSGGHGAEFVTRATRFDPSSGCDLLHDEGGDLLQRVPTPAAREAGIMAERIPKSANAVTEVRPPPIYGLGLMEAVPIADIEALADPDDRDGDGISGRFGTSVDGGPGRFGVKARHATIASFVEDAARGEMGLTTPRYPTEAALQDRSMPPEVDPAPDPEVDEAFLASLVDYIRFLAPPAARPPRDDRDHASIEAGRSIFSRIGCDGCHTPIWKTGIDTSPALREKHFRAYSDFLLHDLGPDLADICAPGAGPAEWRTTPLVGLRLRSIFLHDGMAQNLSAAIEMHGGEAARARDRFRSLPEHARQNLIHFLQSL
ncbi:MAG TPA: di-heme oxidoredictase family protein [Longimicrobiales bacterium]|nr:di-heme oxidoredictase family protein [Longimicrobiales bacterium]